FLDIGANVGYLSLFCANLVKQSCRVIAFEPGEFAFDLLKKNKDLNQFDNLEIYNAGLGEKDEIVQFKGKSCLKMEIDISKIVSAEMKGKTMYTLAFFSGSVLHQLSVTANTTDSKQQDAEAFFNSLVLE
ncbi:MAG: FkbM family methyltransferase, partial [Bacteroidota bacterium]